MSVSARRFSATESHRDRSLLAIDRLFHSINPGRISHLDKLTVAEITSVGKGYSTEVALGRKANLPKDSFVQLDNIQTVSKERLVKYVGSLDAPTMLTWVGR